MRCPSKWIFLVTATAASLLLSVGNAQLFSQGVSADAPADAGNAIPASGNYINVGAPLKTIASLSSLGSGPTMIGRATTSSMQNTGGGKDSLHNMYYNSTGNN